MYAEMKFSCAKRGLFGCRLIPVQNNEVVTALVFSGVGKRGAFRHVINLYLAQMGEYKPVALSSEN